MPQWAVVSVGTEGPITAGLASPLGPATRPRTGEPGWPPAPAPRPWLTRARARYREERRQLRETRREKLQEVLRLQDELLQADLRRTGDANAAMLTHFIRLKAEPPIFYLPVGLAHASAHVRCGLRAAFSFVRGVWTPFPFAAAVVPPRPFAAALVPPRPSCCLPGDSLLACEDPRASLPPPPVSTQAKHNDATRERLSKATSWRTRRVNRGVPVNAEAARLLGDDAHSTEGEKDAEGKDAEERHAEAKENAGDKDAFETVAGRAQDEKDDAEEKGAGEKDAEEEKSGGEEKAGGVGATDSSSKAEGDAPTKGASPAEADE